MFHPEKEQLSRRTTAAHSASRRINQSALRLSPSISGKNLGDIIKVPFCCSRGQRALLFFFFLAPLCLQSRKSESTQTSHCGIVWRCLCLFLSCNTDFLIFLLSVTQSLPGVLPNTPLSPFPHWHSKIHLRALTWIQNVSLLTTCLTSSTLTVVATVLFWLSVRTPSLLLTSHHSTYLNANYICILDHFSGFWVNPAAPFSEMLMKPINTCC